MEKEEEAQESGMKAKEKLHVAVFPWLAYGHLIPYFKVSMFLAQKGHQITFISTPKNIHRLPKLPSNLSSLLNLVELPLPHVEGLPKGAESTSDLMIHQVPHLKKAHDKLEPVLAHLLKTFAKVDWIIHDLVPHWLSKIANQLGIKIAVLSIFNANLMAFLGPPSELLGSRRHRPKDFTMVPEWITYPSNIAYKLYEIVSHQSCMDPGVSDFERTGLVIQSSNCVALRSCFEFEAEALNVLEKIYGKPVLPFGLLPPLSQEIEATEDDNWSVLKEWLDKKEKNTVVYIAFGTEVTLSQDLMHEFGCGIEKSRLPFIWVIRNSHGQVEIPLEFEERLACQGLIWRNWAPQLKILAHSSVGVFLTHCGWSSVIEAISLGQPLILFSGGSSDQGLNARLLHGKGIGLEVPRDDLDGSFTSDSVSESVRRVMVESEGETFRQNAREMKKIFGNLELNNKYLDQFAKFLEDHRSISKQV